MSSVVLCYVVSCVHMVICPLLSSVAKHFDWPLLSYPSPHVVPHTSISLLFVTRSSLRSPLILNRNNGQCSHFDALKVTLLLKDKYSVLHTEQSFHQLEQWASRLKRLMMWALTIGLWVQLQEREAKQCCYNCCQICDILLSYCSALHGGFSAQDISIRFIKAAPVAQDYWL